MKIKPGILTYDFKKPGRMKSNNLGDSMQSIAASRLVGFDWRDASYINREDLSSRPLNLSDGEKTKVLMHGLFAHNKNTFPLNDDVIPNFTSVHINKNYKFTKRAIETYKKFEPIGCRDKYSVERFKKVGIDACFSGCLTLTLEKDERPRSGIVFIIDNIKVNKKGEGIKGYGISGISSYEEFIKWKGSTPLIDFLANSYGEEAVRNATFLTQSIDKNKTSEEQFEMAEKRIDLLSSAELVVTTRISSLTTSMAVGTPVILLKIKGNDLRMKGLIEHWNVINMVKNNSSRKVSNIIIDVDVAFDKNKIINKNTHIPMTEKLSKEVKEWWNSN